MLSDRRKHRRIALELQIEFKKKGAKRSNSGKAVIYKTKIRNISQGGIYIATNKTFPPKTLLDINLKVKSFKKTLKMTGKVVWVAKKHKQPTHFPGMGVQIIGVEAADKKKFLKFMNERMRSFKDAYELKGMYLYLKFLVSRLIELEERHPGAGHFKKAIENAVQELDDVAHLLDKETREVKRL